MGTSDAVAVTEPTWRSPTLAGFKAMAETFDARFGPPTHRDLDSNGIGLYDALCLRFPCGLEVGLARFRLGPDLYPIDQTTEPSWFEVCANQRDLAHIAFHLGVPLDAMDVWTDRDGAPVVTPCPPLVVLMRTDDNGNDVEVRRLTNRCEADALARDYERRGHKQTYWLTSPGPRPT